MPVKSASPVAASGTSAGSTTTHSPFDLLPEVWLNSLDEGTVTLQDFENLFGEHCGQILVATLQSPEDVENLKLLIPDADQVTKSKLTKIKWIQGVGEEMGKEYAHADRQGLISRALAVPYNELAYIITKGKSEVKQMNTIHFSALFALCHQVEYDDRVGCFFEYDSTSGAWKPVSEERIHNRLIRFIAPYAAENMEVYNPKMSTFKEILFHLKAVALHREVKLEEGQLLCARNKVVLIDYDIRSGSAFKSHPHSPAYKLRNPIPIEYDPSKNYPKKFIEMLEGALDVGEIIIPGSEILESEAPNKEGTPEELEKAKKEWEAAIKVVTEAVEAERQKRIKADIDLLQIWCGMVLLGINPFHKIMILSGQAGSGKSTFINLVEKVIGSDNVATLMTGRLEDRFELSEFFGKNLLVGKDVGSDFLSKKSAHMLKSLSGDSGIKAEVKNVQARVRLGGPFNIGIVSNADLKVHLQGDAEAWARRLWVVNFRKPAGRKDVTNYEDNLIKREGSAILNWMLQGARKCLVCIRTRTPPPFTELQKQRVSDLLFRSDELDAFVKTTIKPAAGDLATGEIYDKYLDYCADNDLEGIDYSVFVRQVGKPLRRNYDVSHGNITVKGKEKKGYRGIDFR